MKITVTQLIEELKISNPNAIIHFEGLTFYRVKNRGDVCQIEFSEPLVADDGRLVTFEKSPGGVEKNSAIV
jgi:hypothetical protein